MVTKRLVFLCSLLIGLMGASTALAQPAGFAYVANCGSVCGGTGPGNNISGYRIDGTTGTLTPVAGSPFPAGATPASVTVDPTGQFVYAANAGSSSVSAYIIDGTTGELAPIAGSPFPAGSGPRSVTTTAGPAPPARQAARVHMAGADHQKLNGDMEPACKIVSDCSQFHPTATKFKE